VLQELLKTTERVVQEIDSVEYGLTDIQEYYGAAPASRVSSMGVQESPACCAPLAALGRRACAAQSC